MADETPVARLSTRPRSLLANRVSQAGICAFAAGVAVLVAYGLKSSVGGATTPGSALASLLVSVALMIGGLVSVPIGAYHAHRRAALRGGHPQADTPSVCHPAVKGALVIVLLVVTAGIIPLSVSGYGLLHLTTSTEFCGQLCHTVMGPQSVAHARSPHARVSCASCHIGAGVGPHLKAKLSGVAQVFGVLAGTYRRPLPPALKHLGPASETCEQCHWPSKRAGVEYDRRVYFSADEGNTRRDVHVLLRLDGRDAGGGEGGAIHTRMLTRGLIELQATDETLQDIPWVKYTRTNGDVSIYSKGDARKKLSEHASVRRVFDCMDCHNRDGHDFVSPKASMSRELESGRIDAGLPYILREGVEALSSAFTSTEAALASIEREIGTFYRRNYPELSVRKTEEIEAAVDRIQTIYATYHFPEMKESWRTYPNNVGHRLFPGCFRCHDGLHVDEQGRTIGSECSICHVFITAPKTGTDCVNVGDFDHPNILSLEGRIVEHPTSYFGHERVLCSSCHRGGRIRACEACHAGKPWEALRGTGQLRSPSRKEETSAHGTKTDEPSPKPSASKAFSPKPSDRTAAERSNGKSKRRKRRRRYRRK